MSNPLEGRNLASGVLGIALSGKTLCFMHRGPHGRLKRDATAVSVTLAESTEGARRSL